MCDDLFALFLGHNFCKGVPHIGISFGMFVLAFALLAPRWAPRLPKNPESPSDGTWLEQDFEHQGGVGCAICLFHATVPYPLSLFRVKRCACRYVLTHHQSKAHRHACQKFLHARADPTYGSPSRDQFKVVYDNVLKGHSLNSMTQFSRQKGQADDMVFGRVQTEDQATSTCNGCCYRMAF